MDNTAIKIIPSGFRCAICADGMADWSGIWQRPIHPWKIRGNTVRIISNELQRKFFFGLTEYGVELVK